MIDRSGSLKKVEYEKEIEAVRAIMDCLDFSAQHFWGSIMYWSNGPMTMNTFADAAAYDSGALDGFLDAAPDPRGQTNTWLALDEVRENIIPTRRSAEKIPIISVIFTDGGADNKQLTAAAIASLHGVASRVVSIGVGATRQQNYNEVVKLAGSDGHYFFYTDYDDVLANMSDICAAICNMARPMCCPPYYLVQRPWSCAQEDFVCSPCTY
jgi:hypothetical protein